MSITKSEQVACNNTFHTITNQSITPPPTQGNWVIGRIVNLVLLYNSTRIYFDSDEENLVFSITCLTINKKIFICVGHIIKYRSISFNINSWLCSRKYSHTFTNI